jgi:uncharacterized protein
MKSVKTLEKRYKFTFLPQITFENDEDKRDILVRGLDELEKGRISLKSQELGQKYKTQIENGYFPKTQIKWINRRVGYGLYAGENLMENSYLGEYTGIVRRNDRRYFTPINNYCYEYPVPDSIGRSHVIDATHGNLARFINHSDNPNLKPVPVFIDGFFHVIFLTLKGIKEGEQLSYDYGPSYWYTRSRPTEM